MRLGQTTAFISKYHFELIIILVELIACLIVALTLLKLLAPEPSRVLAAEPQPTQRRPTKLVTLPPMPAQSDPVEAAGIYITVTELQSPTSTPEAVMPDNPRINWPSVSAGSSNSRLTIWPVQGEISQEFGCSPYFTGIPGQGCPSDKPWFHDGVDIVAWSGAPVRAGLTLVAVRHELGPQPHHIDLVVDVKSSRLFVHSLLLFCVAEPSGSVKRKIAPPYL